jgi:hypothetical protein
MTPRLHALLFFTVIALLSDCYLRNELQHAVCALSHKKSRISTSRKSSVLLKMDNNAQEPPIYIYIHEDDLPS